MPKKMKARQTGATLLEQALAGLIQNQAAFLSHLARIESEKSQRFEQIKNILLRHEAILNNLPQALRREIGFKPAK